MLIPLINDLITALNATQAEYKRKEFFQNNFQVSTWNLGRIKRQKKDLEIEINEYTKVIKLLLSINAGEKITESEFNFLNEINYIQHFMCTNKENIGVITRRNSI
jgi:hypothetical protein